MNYGLKAKIGLNPRKTLKIGTPNPHRDLILDMNKRTHMHRASALATHACM
jgi:hypothetical protein